MPTRSRAPASLEARPSFQYDVLRGHEAGNTLLIASRRNITQSLQMLKWKKNADGTYKDKQKKEKQAYTRLMFASIVFTKPTCGRTSMVMANAHLHHLTAKRATAAFGRALNDFWDNLVNDILSLEVTVLAGDFNMSLYQVVGELRQRHIAAHCAAWLPWRKASTGDLHFDSCGIFLLGPISTIRLVNDASVLSHCGSGSASSVAERPDENKDLKP